MTNASYLEVSAAIRDSWLEKAIVASREVVQVLENGI